MSASLRRLSALVLFTSLGALSIGCQQRQDKVPVQTAALTPVPMSVNANGDIPTPAPAAAPIKENTLDTSSSDPPLSSKTILPPPEQHKSYPKVNTPSDERLPSWVPVSGRLTVVSAHDLAKNLGMPAPTTNAAPEAPPQNLGALPPPTANPNEGGFVVRPATPARAKVTPRRGRHPKR